MKKIKSVLLNILVVSFLWMPGSATSATLQLLNSSFDEMVAYFASLTGHTYIQEYQTTKRFSIKRDDLTETSQVQSLFEELVAEAGGQVEKVGATKYKISKFMEPNEEVPGPPIVDPVLFKLRLDNKISFSGLKSLISADERLTNLKIIEEVKKENAVLILGINSELTVLSEFISNLPDARVDPSESIVQAVPDPTNEDLAPSAERTVTTVVDLNYADSSEIVANLQPILSGQELAVSIAPHASANQIIVSGPAAAVKDTLELIQKLDRIPRQVYVDAIIAEVSDETAAKLGLQFSINSENLSASAVTGVSGVNIGAAAGDPFLAGATGGIFAAGRGANVVPDIGLMLTALEGNTDNRILATPSLMATENKESVILVGQNVPFITGQYTNQDGGNTTPFQTIKREDLGTSLKLKPKIGSNGNIVMEIWQEVSRIDQSAPGLSDVVTVKRQISTVISAREGETVAIGGLKIEQQELGVSKVPVLGDLPLIGGAFRQEVTNSVTRNLAIFLRPTLVTNSADRKRMFNVWQKSLEVDLDNPLSEKSLFFDLEKDEDAFQLGKDGSKKMPLLTK